MIIFLLMMIHNLPLDWLGIIYHNSNNNNNNIKSIQDDSYDDDNDDDDDDDDNNNNVTLFLYQTYICHDQVSILFLFYCCKMGRGLLIYANCIAPLLIHWYNCFHVYRRPCFMLSQILNCFNQSSHSVSYYHIPLHGSLSILTASSSLDRY